MGGVAREKIRQILQKEIKRPGSMEKRGKLYPHKKKNKEKAEQSLGVGAQNGN